MTRLKIRNFIIWTVLLLLVVMSIVQLIRLKTDDPEPGNAIQLLYQVSAFQFELLANALQEAVNASVTDDLNDLRQSLYTANYTHEHLVLAVGTKKLTPLHSLTDLMQYILRLQIGGNRALKASESEVLRQLNETFQQMHAAYQGLFSGNGIPISTRNEQLTKLDETLSSQINQVHHP